MNRKSRTAGKQGGSKMPRGSGRESGPREVGKIGSATRGSAPLSVLNGIDAVRQKSKDYLSEGPFLLSLK